MDITAQSTAQPTINDDQELAKALAGVLPDVPEPAAAPVTDPAPVAPVLTPAALTPPADDPAPVAPAPQPTQAVASNDLDSIKKDALSELRPLVDKVDLPAEEKFDTYLMLIRSTDDTSLIAPAHAVALTITDEKRKAEALLDIIKEIDYLSRDKNASV
jgi:hypothetical protein